MLGFGIFTSFVPYLVMVILYMAYFLMASFSGIKAKEDIALSEEGNKAVVDNFVPENARVDSDDVKNYIATNFDFSNDEAPAPEAGNSASASGSIISCVNQDNDPTIISPHFVSCLFSRPPPHC